MFEQFVEFRIGIIGERDRAAGVEIRVHLRVGIGEIDDPPRRQLKLAHEGARYDGGLIDLLDLHIGADLLPKLLQHLADIAPARRRGHEHLELDRLAIVLDQRLGFFNIGRQCAVILALDPRTFAIGVRRWPAEAVGDGLRHLLAVDRHHQCLAHAHIVERGGLGVEGVDLGAGPDIGVHRQLGIFLSFLNIVGIVFIVPDNIRFARLQTGEARLRIRQWFQHDPVEIRMPLIPVVGISFENHPVARVP